jgi:hypothetical protein
LFSLHLRLLITFFVLFLLFHCIVFPSIYGFSLPLWYFFFNTIVLSVPQFTTSDYLFDPFSLIPWYCLSLDLRLLITSFVLFLLFHCIFCPSIYGFWLPIWYFFFNSIVLSVPRFTASDYLFGNFSLIPCIVYHSIYGFWLPFWYFFFNTMVLSVPRYSTSDYLFCPFSLIPLYGLSPNWRFWLPL